VTDSDTCNSIFTTKCPLNCIIQL